MMVCVCKGVNDQKVRWLVQNGNRTLRDVMNACHAGSDCGSCLTDLRELVAETSKSLANSDNDTPGLNPASGGA